MHRLVSLLLLFFAVGAGSVQAAVVRYDCMGQMFTPGRIHFVASIDFTAHTATLTVHGQAQSFNDVTISPDEISWSDQTGGYSIDRRSGAYVHSMPTVHEDVPAEHGQCTMIERPPTPTVREYYLCWAQPDHWPTVLLAVAIMPESGGALGRVDVIGDPKIGGLRQPYSGEVTQVRGPEIRWDFSAGSFWLNRQTLSLWGGVNKGAKPEELAPMRCRPYSVIG